MELSYMIIPGLDRDYVRRQNVDIEIKKFMNAFFKATNTNELMVCGKSRKREHVRPRQMLHYLMYLNFRNMSLQSIGKLIGEKDHATVLHSNRTVKNDLETDKHYQDEFIRIVTEMRSLFSPFPIKMVD